MMTTFETRRESHNKLNKQQRYSMIIQCIKDNGPMTAREIAYKLQFYERNATSPRLTELVQLGIVEAVGKKHDYLTNRNVTLFGLKEVNKW